MIRYKELRLDKDLTQREISSILNVKRATYSKWEDCVNDMPLEKCNELANYYHTSLDYILGLSNKHTYIKENLNINWNLFNKRLHTIRKEKKLSQQQLSDKLGFPQTTYSQFERGITKPTVLKILTMAQYYNISMDYLTGRHDKKTVN